jgi:hypothetical protein
MSNGFESIFDLVKTAFGGEDSGLRRVSPRVIVTRCVKVW